MITTKGFFMSHSESFKYQIISKYLYGKIHRSEASKLLNVCPRTITRYSSKVKKLGMIGEKHENSGNQFNKKHTPELIYKIYDFNLSYFHEVLVKEHNIEILIKLFGNGLKNSI